MYPPVRATLLALSKLYRAVDVRIFGGLAQEAVSAATLSVQQASRMVGGSRVQGPCSWPHGHMAGSLLP